MSSITIVVRKSIKETENNYMKKVLIANRGEIAVRVIRTLNKMGIQSVAVYSDADQDGLFVAMADEAYHIGPAPSAQSYLDIDKIIQVAKHSGVDAIHPGYGFLSENATFAERLKKEGITLIGPSAESMRVMGSKLAAKDAVSNYDIPMVPGIDHAIEDPEKAIAIADEIGYPILIKASAGGGGKGMRIVEQASEMKEQIETAISEAKSSFGDGSVFIEKYIKNPRHIEIQVLGDNYGNYIHLNERECSIQRRHQKVIEEAPSCVLTPELRSRMGQAAIDVARSCDYTGVGTVEFLLDADKQFYFLEMNTRLQVEHPVTELITGIDLVEQQIRVARGEKLSIDQDAVGITGHAIELRVYAEDPFNDFLPSINVLSRYQEPSGEGIRVDSGFTEGMNIPIYYDPMISKLIVYASNRSAAIAKMIEAIEKYEIEGIESTLDFGAFVMNHEAFISGDFDTHFVKKYWSEDSYREMFIKDAEAVVTLMDHIFKAEAKRIVIPKT